MTIVAPVPNFAALVEQAAAAFAIDFQYAENIARDANRYRDRQQKKLAASAEADD